MDVRLIDSAKLAWVALPRVTPDQRRNLRHRFVLPARRQPSGTPVLGVEARMATTPAFFNASYAAAWSDWEDCQKVLASSPPYRSKSRTIATMKTLSSFGQKAY